MYCICFQVVSFQFLLKCLSRVPLSLNHLPFGLILFNLSGNGKSLQADSVSDRTAVVSSAYLNNPVFCFINGNSFYTVQN